jgi:hypothetical protein
MQREAVETMRELDGCLQHEVCANNCFAKYEPMEQGFELKKRGGSWDQAGDEGCQSRLGEGTVNLTTQAVIMQQAVLSVIFLAVCKIMTAVLIVRLL